MRRVTRAYTAPFAALLGLVLLGACSLPGFGPGDGEPSPPAATATATAVPAEYPKVVTDLLGREVTLPRQPATVVALSQTAVELVYATGGTVAGRPDGATYPPEAADAATIGDTYTPNIVAIEQLAPDLIVADSVIHSLPSIRSQLEALDAPVVFAGAQNIAQVREALTVVGAALGRESEAGLVVAAILTRLVEAQGVLGEHGTTAVILLADRSGTLYASLHGSFAGDLLVQLGFENPAGDAPPAGPIPGFAPITAEAIVAANPEIVLTIGTGSVPLSQSLQQNAALADLDAIANNNIVELDEGLALRSPGPRVVDLIDIMVAAARP